MDLKPVLHVLGLLLTILGASMVFPMAVDLLAGSSNWKSFFIAMLFTAFVGGTLALGNAQDRFTLNTRQGFLLTTSSWLVVILFASVPFMLSDIHFSPADAIFETTSGITTTGATIITNLESMPPGLLLWRALLQWLGGIGIIVMALSLLPFLKVGGMQLFRTESSENEKAFPKAAQIAGAISLVYVALTAICGICYYWAGMSAFDAVAHAMTTIATGGFSTFDTSFSHYDTNHAEILAIFFMLCGGLPFVLYLRAVTGHPGDLLRDTQVRWFLGIICLSVVMMTLYLIFYLDEPWNVALEHAAFSVSTTITGTGYANSDYSAWGAFPLTFFLFLMVVGGCAGSTTCGIKIFRFQILYAVAVIQLKRLLYPSGVFLPHYRGTILSREVILSVMSFFFVYALSFVLLSIALAAVGLDFLTAVSGAITAVSNVGPGLGPVIGPASTFASLPDAAKWILCTGMIIGRLELFTVLILFSPDFWRR